jgi:signal peptidase I
MITKRGLGLGVCLSVIAGAILLLAGAFGSKPMFLTTHGTSMEPRFHTGDLAILRPVDSYHVGDVVAYHSTALNTVVMHRIVKIDNGRYTFKGDNNTWLDPAPAGRDQLLGKLLLRVPRGGLVLEWARRFAPLVLAGVVMVVGLGFVTKRRRRPHGRHTSENSRRPSSRVRRLPPELATAAAITAALALLGVVLGVLGLRAPAARGADPAPPAGPAAARTVFSYSAAVGHTPAYDRTTVRAPSPIFRKVTNLVDLTAAYEGPAGGTFSLVADLSTQAGWRSRVVLVASTAFTGTGVSRTVGLDLRSFDRRAQAAAATTGIPAAAMGIDVTAAVIPTSGKPFTSVLHLSMTGLELSMSGGRDALVHQATAAPAVVRAGAKPSMVSLLGHPVATGTVLATAVLLLLASAIGAGVVMGRVRALGRASEGDAIRRRYAALLVPVEPISAPAGRPVVDVPEIATLAKIAECYELLVLHWSRAGVETFIVQHESTTYRYRAAGPAGTAGGAARGAHRARPRPGGGDTGDEATASPSVSPI